MSLSTRRSRTPEGAVDRLSGSAWGALIVLRGALFLDALDLSSIGVALPPIRTDLHAGGRNEATVDKHRRRN